MTGRKEVLSTDARTCHKDDALFLTQTSSAPQPLTLYIIHMTAFTYQEQLASRIDRLHILCVWYVDGLDSCDNICDHE